jgi:fructose-1,6-bisphosphatase/inositol monophosphatase family enzyme
VEGASLLELFTNVAGAIRAALDGLDDWGSAPGHAGQYRHDVVAGDVAVPMLTGAGLGVLSEESGPHTSDHPIMVVIDPIDGSTNASVGLPWFATSICAVDGDGPLAALVVNQALAVAYTAIRGEGARRNGDLIAPAHTSRVEDALLVFNDWPTERIGCRQFRALGAAALDMCAVADGTVDGFVDFSGGLSPWDHLGASLICAEAGASVASVGGHPMLDLRHDARTRVVAGATPELCSALASLAGP